jgi:hypothetical protein
MVGKGPLVYLLRGVLTVRWLLLPRGPPLPSASMSLSLMDFGSDVKDWFASIVGGEFSEIPELSAPGVEDMASFCRADSRSPWAQFREQFGDGEAG